MNYNTVKPRVFLCVDATSRAIWVRTTSTHKDGIDRIEDAGLEVVEEQTENYEGTPVSEWDDTILLRQLNQTDAVLFQ